MVRSHLPVRVLKGLRASGNEYMNYIAYKPFPYSIRGVSLIEVMVTIFILAIGLLGLAGLQTQLQSSQLEAFQRAQALILVGDMSNRIATNRGNAASYVTGTTSPLGTGDSQPTNCTGVVQSVDACQWSNALKGAAEQSGTANVGAMIGARGCVEQVATNQYLVTLVWQGLTPISAPTSKCGKGLYDGASGSTCVNDLCRRTVSTVLHIANLGT